MGMPTGATLPTMDSGADVIGGSNIPVADQGMDAVAAPAAAPVDIHDGQHQVAILKAGEKVLNPDEADAYRAEHDTPQMQPLGKPKPQMQQMAVHPPTGSAQVQSTPIMDQGGDAKGVTTDPYAEFQPSSASSTPSAASDPYAEFAPASAEVKEA